MPHTEKRYKKGEIICRPKEMVMSMYNILYGSVGCTSTMGRRSRWR